MGDGEDKVPDTTVTDEAGDRKVEEIMAEVGWAQAMGMEEEAGVNKAAMAAGLAVK